MSLFGDEPPQPARKTASSLFDDSPTAAPQKPQAGGGLFADAEDPPNESGSPWGAQFTPKKQARSDLVKNLLSGDSVPDLYIDTFDSLADEGFVQGSEVNERGLEKLFEAGRIDANSRTQITELVSAGARDKKTFSRSEINVVLALVGLAQEGEEVSLDSVDERRRSKSRTHSQAPTFI